MSYFEDAPSMHAYEFILRPIIEEFILFFLSSFILKSSRTIRDSY